MAVSSQSAVWCWVRLSCLLTVLVLVLVPAAAGWRFDPWSQQWVAEETKQPAAQAHQGNALHGHEQDYRGYRAAPRQDTRTVECKKRNKAGRCLTKTERELLLPNGFQLALEPKVAFNLYDDDDIGSKYLTQIVNRGNPHWHLIQIADLFFHDVNILPSY